MLHEHRFRAMNTDVGVWLWSGGAEHAPIVHSSFSWAQGLFARVEQELSRFRSTSALNRLNQLAGCGPQAVPPLLWSVLDAAFRAANDSGGIYDPTLCRTIDRLGYDRSFECVERTGEAHENPPIPAFCAWQRVQLNSADRSVSLPPDLALDLGGIAKGWTVDQVALALAPIGPVLVDAGGRPPCGRHGEWRGLAGCRAGSVRAGTGSRARPTAPRCARDEQSRGTLLAARKPDAPPRDRSANGDVSQ